MYDSESWTISNQNKSKIRTIKMTFLRRVEEITRRERVGNVTGTSQLNISYTVAHNHTSENASYNAW